MNVQKMLIVSSFTVIKNYGGTMGELWNQENQNSKVHPLGECNQLRHE